MSTDNPTSNPGSNTSPAVEIAAELRIQKKAPPKAPPTFTSTIVLTATGADAAAAIAYVVANACRFNRVATEVFTATAPTPDDPSPIAALISGAVEIGQMPDSAAVAQLAHFDPQIDRLIAGKMSVIGLAPHASRYFCECVMASVTQDDGSRPAVKVIVVAEESTTSLASAARLMEQVDKISALIPMSGRHLLLVDVDKRNVGASATDRMEAQKAQHAFKFIACKLPPPAPNFMIGDSALASVTKEFMSAKDKGVEFMRWTIGWRKWVDASTQTMIKDGVLPDFDLQTLPQVIFK